VSEKFDLSKFATKKRDGSKPLLGVVTAHGKRIEVETHLPPEKKRKRTEFVQIFVQLVSDMVTHMQTQDAGVWIAVIQEVWKNDYKPFTLSNEKLARYGVTSRDVKRRILGRLADYGYIAIEQEGKCAPVVTWLGPRLS
jgi:hypothetical protein